MQLMYKHEFIYFLFISHTNEVSLLETVVMYTSLQLVYSNLTGFEGRKYKIQIQLQLKLLEGKSA